MSVSITREMIRESSDPRSFARGEEYYQDGAVDVVVRRGDIVQAEVDGSDVEPYLVTVTLGERGVVEAECTCPYEWGGWCKHVVAVLLACADEPEAVEERPALDTRLAALSRDQLQAVVLELAQLQPELIAVIERTIKGLGAPASPVAPAGPDAPIAAEAAVTVALPALNPAAMRKQVRAVLRSVARGGYDYYDETGGYDELTGTLGDLEADIQAWVDAGHGGVALPALEAITDEMIDGWEGVVDYIGDLTDFYIDYGVLWAEAFLTADLTQAERGRWIEKLEKWQKADEGSGIGGALDTAIVAARQGWDYPPLVRVLQGEITDKGAWEDEPANGADELAIARLNVLERQGRLQEAAYLAQAEGQTERYLDLLVRLGRASEAVEDALEVLTQTDPVLALAQKLDQQGEPALALQLGEHGLGLDGYVYSLAIWLRDVAVREDQTDLAIKAARAAFEEKPVLPDYLRLQEIAGADWAALKESLLEHVRQPANTIYGGDSGRVDILLHEGLIEEALRVVSGSWNYDLVARVVDAAIPVLPEPVIPICKQQAEAIMDAGKADRYHHAAKWVERVRDAYRAAGKSAEWQAYKTQLLTLHQRKYKLVPMLKPL